MIGQFDIRRKIIHPLFGLTARADGSGSSAWVQSLVIGVWLLSMLAVLILVPLTGHSAFLLVWPATMLITWRSGIKVGMLLGIISIGLFSFLAASFTGLAQLHGFMIAGSVYLVFIVMVSLIRSSQLQWQRALQRSEAREHLLQELTAAFSKATTPHQVAQVIVDQAIGALGGNSGSVTRFASGGKSLELLAGLNIKEGLKDKPCVVRSDSADPISDVVRLGKPLWIESSEEYAEHYPPSEQGITHFASEGALAGLPLISGEQIIGALTIGFPASRHLTLRERTFLLRMADLCAQALERARLYEDEQQAHQQAEQANQLKTKFLGMVSHELRTPLASIKGFSSTLLADDVTWEPEQQRDFIATIDEESNKLTELVDQLLDLSRLQAGTLPIHPQPQSLERLFDYVRSQLQMLACDHQLVFDIPADLPPVQVDTRRIAQVLTNLVENAAKFAPTGTHITVAARHYEGGREVCMSVADEGPGIPAEARNYVFELFHQIDMPNRSTLRGAGLGLAICKGIVEAHEGHIWVQEHSGPGATVSFTVPTAL